MRNLDTNIFYYFLKWTLFFYYVCSIICNNINTYMRKLDTNSKHPLYNTWKQLKKKGKPIPDKWSSFNQFIKDLPIRPKGMDKYVLKRIDKYSPYSKSNIEWVKLKKYVTPCNKRTTNEINTSSIKHISAPCLD